MLAPAPAAGPDLLRIPHTLAARENGGVSPARSWWIALGALAALRVAPPLAALAAEGRDLPGLPRFDLEAGTGDDAGFYAAAREFMAATGRVPVPLAALGLLVVVAATIAAIRLWSHRDLRPWLVAGAGVAVGLAVALPILEMEPSGSAVIGWSLLWSLPLLPYRALGLPLDYETAFAFAFPLSLAANVVALVATAYAGLYATGRRAVGLTAAAALAIWPLVSGLVAGASAWENGTWFVDTGLALYTEPLSTALVAVALALLLRPGRSDLQLALAGVLLSSATVVKLTNGVAAALAVALVAGFLGLRRALPLAVGGLAFVPPLVAYWPIGYVQGEGGANLLPPDPFSLDYVARSWSDSLLFSPRTLVVLLPLAVVGALVLRRGFALALLVAFTLVNPVLYSFYEPTHVHPRFLFVSLPSFFVLWASGLVTAADRGRRLRPIH